MDFSEYAVTYEDIPKELISIFTALAHYKKRQGDDAEWFSITLADVARVFNLNETDTIVAFHQLVDHPLDLVVVKNQQAPFEFTEPLTIKLLEIGKG